MTLDLEELRRLEREATKGPWLIWRQPVASVDEAKVELLRLAEGTPQPGAVLPMLTTDTETPLCPATTGFGKDSVANAELIAALRNAAPALLDRLEALEKREAELSAEVERHKGYADACESAFMRASEELSKLRKERR